MGNFLQKYSLGLEKPKKASSYESVLLQQSHWEVVNDEHMSTYYMGIHSV